MRRQLGINRGAQRKQERLPNAPKMACHWGGEVFELTGAGDASDRKRRAGRRKARPNSTLDVIAKDRGGLRIHNRQPLFPKVPLAIAETHECQSHFKPHRKIIMSPISSVSSSTPAAVSALSNAKPATGSSPAASSQSASIVAQQAARQAAATTNALSYRNSFGDSVSITGKVVVDRDGDGGVGQLAPAPKAQ